MEADSLRTNSPMAGGAMHPAASRGDYGQGGGPRESNDPFDYPTPSQRHE
jgi:hypothetical protein